MIEEFPEIVLDLKNNIRKKDKKIAIVGLGSVGLPLAFQFLRY